MQQGYELKQGFVDLELGYGPEYYVDYSPGYPEENMYVQYQRTAWWSQFKVLDDFVSCNHRLPNLNMTSLPEVRLLEWMHQQPDMQIGLMDEQIGIIWTRFCAINRHLLLTPGQQWVHLFGQLNYFLENSGGNWPSYAQAQSRQEEMLSCWANEQHDLYGRFPNQSRGIMQDPNLHSRWKEMRKQYPDLFMSSEELEWFQYCDDLNVFLTESNGKLPNGNVQSESDLWRWTKYQMKNYNPSSPETSAGLMRRNKIHEKWAEMIVQFPDTFISHEDRWIRNLQKVEQILKANPGIKFGQIKKKNRPIGEWLLTQCINWEQRLPNCIMANPWICECWEDFWTQYPGYFEKPEEWQQQMDRLKDHWTRTNELPNQKRNRELHTWMMKQVELYDAQEGMMIIPNIYDQWTEFRGISGVGKMLLTNPEDHPLPQLSEYMVVARKPRSKKHK